MDTNPCKFGSYKKGTLCFRLHSVDKQRRTITLDSLQCVCFAVVFSHLALIVDYKIRVKTVSQNHKASLKKGLFILTFVRRNYFSINS